MIKGEEERERKGRRKQREEGERKEGVREVERGRKGKG